MPYTITVLPIDFEKYDKAIFSREKYDGRFINSSPINDVKPN